MFEQIFKEIFKQLTGGGTPTTLGTTPPHGRCDQGLYQNQASWRPEDICPALLPRYLVGTAGHHQYGMGTWLYFKLIKELKT